MVIGWIKQRVSRFIKKIEAKTGIDIPYVGYTRQEIKKIRAPKPVPPKPPEPPESPIKVERKDRIVTVTAPAVADPPRILIRGEKPHVVEHTPKPGFLATFGYKIAKEGERLGEKVAEKLIVEPPKVPAEEKFRFARQYREAQRAVVEKVIRPLVKGAVSTPPAIVGAAIAGVEAWPRLLANPETIKPAAVGVASLAIESFRRDPIRTTAEMAGGVLMLGGLTRVAAAKIPRPEVVKAAYTKAIAERVPMHGVMVGRAKDLVIIKSGKRLFKVTAKTEFAARQVTKKIAVGVSKSRLVAEAAKEGLGRKAIHLKPKQVRATLEGAGITFKEVPVKGYDITFAGGKLYLKGKPVTKVGGIYLTRRGVVEIRKGPITFERMATVGREATETITKKPKTRMVGVTDIITVDRPTEIMRLVFRMPPRKPPVEVPKVVKPVKIKPKPKIAPPRPPVLEITPAAKKLVGEMAMPKPPKPKILPAIAAVFPRLVRPKPVKVVKKPKPIVLPKPPKPKIAPLVVKPKPVKVEPIAVPKVKPVVKVRPIVKPKIVPKPKIAPIEKVIAIPKIIPKIKPIIKPIVRPIKPFFPFPIPIKMPVKIPPIMPPFMWPIKPVRPKKVKVPKPKPVVKMPKKYMPSLAGAALLEPAEPELIKKMLLGLEVRPPVKPKPKPKKVKKVKKTPKKKPKKR